MQLMRLKMMEFKYRNLLPGGCFSDLLRLWP
jgi:hypothetical protein